MARPVDDNDRRRVRELHAGGESRNDIAHAVKRSSSTGSKIAGSFDRAPQVEAATRVRTADLAASRAALALEVDAERLRTQL